jgi:hypothetical protein
VLPLTEAVRRKIVTTETAGTMSIRGQTSDFSAFGSPTGQSSSLYGGSSNSETKSYVDLCPSCNALEDRLEAEREKLRVLKIWAAAIATIVIGGWLLIRALMH